MTLTEEAKQITTKVAQLAASPTAAMFIPAAVRELLAELSGFVVRMAERIETLEKEHKR